MPARLSPPELVDLVPAERVREIIALTDRDIAELERRANEACGEADQAELRAQESGVDGRSATWAMVRMQRFLDGLRSEGERDAQALRDLARERAELRLADARAEAARIRDEAPQATAVVDPAPIPPVDVAPAPDLAPPAPPAAPVIAPVIAPVPESPPVAAGNGHGRPPVDAAPALPADEDTSIEDLLRAPDAAAPAPPAPAVQVAASEPEHELPDPTTTEAVIVPAAVSTPSAIDEAPVPSSRTGGAAVLVAPEAPAAPAADDAAPASEFWPQQETKPKRGIRRIPISAVLEVLAVLLILVFILLRLS